MNQAPGSESVQEFGGNSASATARIFVIIPARSSDGTLHGCLSALSASRIEHLFEIILVHDGRGSDHPGLGVRQLHSPVSNSAAAARNHGAAGLNDGILVFIDADVMVDRQSISDLVEPILSGAAEATVGNYSLDVRGLNFIQSYKQIHIATVYGRRNGYLKSEFWTALGAVRADLFHRIGGFAPSFRGACGEDTELGGRMTEAGFRILAVPTATGKHLHRFTLRKLVLNDLRKGTQTALTILRHRNKLSDNRHSAPPEILAVSCAMLLLGLLPVGVLLPAPATVSIFFVSFGAWLLSRTDQLRVHAQYGRLHLARAVPLALLLDWVRGLCLAIALGRYICEGLHNGKARE